jgi:hypothetical protein
MNVLDGFTVWVCVAREGGLLEDIEVVGSETEANDIVRAWSEDMDPVQDGDAGGTIYYDANNADWYFEVWPKVIGKVEVSK